MLTWVNRYKNKIPRISATEQVPRAPVAPSLHDDAAASPTPADPFAPLPRALLTQLMHLYFNYKFWLAPYPHKPSFERDFERRREREDGQEEWVALVYGMATNALMLPARLLPVSADEAKRLVGVSFELMMRFLRREYDEYSVDRCEWRQCGGADCCRSICDCLVMSASRHADPAEC